MYDRAVVSASCQRPGRFHVEGRGEKAGVGEEIWVNETRCLADGMFERVI